MNDLRSNPARATSVEAWRKMDPHRNWLPPSHRRTADGSSWSVNWLTASLKTKTWRRRSGETLYEPCIAMLPRPVIVAARHG